MAVLHTRGAPARFGRAAAGLPILWRLIEAHPLAATLGLGVRLYLASVWLRFALQKIHGGWLTSNPLRPMLELVVNGYTHVAFHFYQPLTRWVLELGADRLLAVAFPLTELTIATAFVAGVLVRPAALVAIFINLNLILTGLAMWHFDGRIIALQVLLLALGTAAGRYGVRSLWPLGRRWAAAVRRFFRRPTAPRSYSPGYALSSYTPVPTAHGRHAPGEAGRVTSSWPLTRASRRW
jgi:uncharacterized membrane protein YphA (DoxX/SURF4 family)